MTEKIRRMFPGGNTSRGFYSYYDYIIEKDANRIFVLKGGPGTGKSSLMKKVANIMTKKGYDIEYHHCSSDNESIDGLVIPNLKVAMIDGTAPHIVDPKNPGAVDEIIHLGDYWDVRGLESNKESIIYYIEKNAKFYKTAYKYLEAARLIIEDIIWKHEESLIFGDLNKETDVLIQEILGHAVVSKEVGKTRHLFGSAYTPRGYIDYTEEQIGSPEEVKIYYIEGDVGTGKSTMLTKIYKNAVEKGYDVEVFHTPLIPEKIMSVNIKELNIALTTSQIYKDNSYREINLEQNLDKNYIERYSESINEDKIKYEELLKIALKNISRAKENHDKIEDYYIPNMNFDEYNELRDRIVSKMLRYE
ncbi:MAG: ATPase [Eubacteriales bacterium]